MQAMFTRHKQWLFLLMKGVLAIAFGALALLLPRVTLGFFVFLFAAYILLDGIFSTVISLRERHTNRYWWVNMLEGGVGLLIALVTILWPNITEMVFIMIVAAGALIIGITELIAIIRHQIPRQDRTLTLIFSILSLLLGIVLLFQINSNISWLIRVIGIYAICFGVIQIMRTYKAHTNEAARVPTDGHAMPTDDIYDN